MKLVAGVTSLKQAQCLIPMGADEIYCAMSSIHSHRAPSEGFRDAGELKELAGLCARSKKPLYLAVNEIYEEKGYPAILEKTARFISDGGTGLIIRDLGLAAFLRGNGFNSPLILSTLGFCFNTEALKFYSRQGFSRITLPQLLTAAEAGGLMKNIGKLETEVMYSPADHCVNLNGACSLHDAPRMKSALKLAACNCALRFSTAGGPFRFPALSGAERYGSLEKFYELGAGYLKVPRSSDLNLTKRIVSEALEFLDEMRDKKDRKRRKAA